MGRPPKKPKLPKHVFIKDGSWYVRRNFRTQEKYPSGAPVYAQVARKCEPQTEERSRDVYKMLGHLASKKPENDTIETFISFFLDMKRSSVAARTYEGDQELFERYVKGSPFARSSIALVTPLSLQTFYNSLEKAGVSGAMIRKLHRLLSAAFGQAVTWEKLKVKPKGILLPSVDETEIEYFTKAEARRFTEHAFSKYLVLALALETGMRPGEYLGLRWQDVNMEARTLTIQKAVSFLRSGYEIKRPKTKKSKRTIHITPRLANALREYRLHYEKTLQVLQSRARAKIDVDHFNARQGANYKKRKHIRSNARKRLKHFVAMDLVFPSLKGEPMNQNNLSFKTMRKACEEAGVPRRSLYSLRHTHITLLLLAGTDVKTIAERCGTSAEMIWRTYGHVLPEMRSGAVDRLTEILYAEEFV